MKKLVLGGLAGVALAGALFVRLTMMLFVIPPIGAIPDGGTLLMWRMGSMQFIDSADAVCARTTGGVSLLCRGVILGKVGLESEGQVLLRLPYSHRLYLWSTDGQEFDL